MRFLNLLVILLCASSFELAAQKLSSGPMPGYSTMREVGVWLQLDKPATIQLEYWPENSPSKSLKTEPVKCTKENAAVGKFVISGLEPGTTYAYRILNGTTNLTDDLDLKFHTQALWQFRTDPPNFRLALGSCTYINEEPYDRPGAPYGGNYEIFDAIANTNPDMMLWLGDNIYLREVDWDTRSGILHRYTHTRATPQLQQLLQSTHHYAIWDDHDFGPNDGNGSWLHKDKSLEAFELFWINPTTGVPGLKGITTAFEFNDMDFFLLDNRYNRTSNQLKSGNPQILGKDQIDWLIEALKYSRAPFKFVAVGGQLLSTAAIYENHAVYAEEREYILRRIDEEGIRGVVFLTGDRHHTELSKLETKSGILIYDLTASPLTSKAYNGNDENNTVRVEGTLVNERNFAVLDFSGPRKDRSMKISIFGSDGGLKWEQTIKSNN
ncbi:MAG: alkaline phosphatase D family protein [Flavobacteriales bacterium]